MGLEDREWYQDEVRRKQGQQPKQSTRSNSQSVDDFLRSQRTNKPVRKTSNPRTEPKPKSFKPMTVVFLFSVLVLLVLKYGIDQVI